MSGVSTVLHLVFDLFDLNEMSRIERKGRVVAVAFMSAKAAVSDTVTTGVHCGGVPEFREIPVIVAQIRHRIQNFAARHRAFIIYDCTRASGPTLKLRTSFESCLHDQLVHVYVDCRLEKTGVAR